MKRAVFCSLLLSFGGAFAYNECDEWFAAAFDGTECAGGVLSQETLEGRGELYQGRLYVDDASRDCPVEFRANEGRTGGGSIEEWEIVSRIDFGCGHEEVPRLPSVGEEVKAAVAPMEDGNFLVLGYDEDGMTNVWIDTGIAYSGDGEVEIAVRFSGSAAVYRIGDTETAAVPVASAVVEGRVMFAGSGSVGTLCGRGVLPDGKVRIVLPEIPGLVVQVIGSDGKPAEYADVGGRVSVLFDVGTMFPSREAAWYAVRPDGTLEFDDEGESPYAVCGEVIAGGCPFRFFTDVLNEGPRHLSVTLTADVVLDTATAYNQGRLELAGHVVRGDGELVFGSGSDPELWRNTVAGGRIETDIVAETDLELGAAGWIVGGRIVIGSEAVRVTSAVQLKDVVSGRRGFGVVETLGEDGGYVYGLVVKSPEQIALEEQAYLLGCDVESVAEELDKFRIVGISCVDGRWDVRVRGGKGDGDRYGNGYISIKRVDLPGSGDDSRCGFFKAELLPAPPSE